MPKDLYDFEINVKSKDDPKGFNNTINSISKVEKKVDQLSKSLEEVNSTTFSTLISHLSSIDSRMQTLISLGASANKILNQDKSQGFNKLNSKVTASKQDIESLSASVKKLTDQLYSSNPLLLNIISKQSKEAKENILALNKELQTTSKLAQENANIKVDYTRVMPGGSGGTPKTSSTLSTSILDTKTPNAERPGGHKNKKEFWDLQNPFLGALGFLGIQDSKRTIFDTTTQNETNKILLEKMGGDYATFDKVTNETLTSIQELIPAMNAMSVSASLNADQVNATAGTMANFGAYVKTLTGSDALAQSSMYYLSRAYQGQYAGVDQYGITKENLKKTGKWSGEDDTYEHFMEAVSDIMGSQMDQLMGTTQGQMATLRKGFSLAGKQVGAVLVKPIDIAVRSFNALNSALGNLPSQLVLLGNSVLSGSIVMFNLFNDVSYMIDSFKQVKQRLNNWFEGGSFWDNNDEPTERAVNDFHNTTEKQLDEIHNSLNDIVSKKKDNDKKPSSFNENQPIEHPRDKPDGGYNPDYIHPTRPKTKEELEKQHKDRTKPISQPLSELPSNTTPIEMPGPVFGPLDKYNKKLSEQGKRADYEEIYNVPSFNDLLTPNNVQYPHFGDNLPVPVDPGLPPEVPEPETEPKSKPTGMAGAENFEEFWDLYTQMQQERIRNAGNTTKNLKNTVGNKLFKYGQEFYNDPEAFGTRIRNTPSKVWGTGKEVFKNHKEDISYLSQAKSGIKSSISYLKTQVRTQITPQVTRIRSLFGNIITKLKSPLKSIDSVSSSIRRTINKLKRERNNLDMDKNNDGSYSFFDNIFKRAKRMMGDILARFNDGSDDIIEKFMNWGRMFIGNMRIPKIGENIQSIFDRLMERFRNLNFNALPGDGGNRWGRFEDIVNKLRDNFNTFTRGIRDIPGKLSKVLNKWLNRNPNLPDDPNNPYQQPSLFDKIKEKLGRDKDGKGLGNRVDDHIKNSSLGQYASEKLGKAQEWMEKEGNPEKVDMVAGGAVLGGAGISQIGTILGNDTISGLGETLSTMGTIYETLSQIVGGTGNLFKIISRIPAVLTSIFGSLSGAIVGIGVIIIAVKLLQRYWDNICGTIGEFFGWLKGLAVTMFVEPLMPLFQALDDVWNAIMGIFGGEGSGDILVDLGNIIKQVLQPVAAIINFLAQLIGLVIKVLITPFVGVIKGLAYLIKWIVDCGKATYNALASFFGPIIKLFQDFYNWVMGTFGWIGKLLNFGTDEKRDFNSDGQEDKAGMFTSMGQGLIDERDNQGKEPEEEEKWKGFNEQSMDMENAELPENVNLENLDTRSTQSLDDVTKTAQPSEVTPQNVEENVSGVSTSAVTGILDNIYQLLRERLPGLNTKENKTWRPEGLKEFGSDMTTATPEMGNAMRLNKEELSHFNQKSTSSLDDANKLQTILGRPHTPLLSEQGPSPEDIINVGQTKLLLTSPSNVQQPMKMPHIQETKIQNNTSKTADESQIVNNITINVDNVNDKKHINTLIEELTKALTFENIRAGRSVGMDYYTK